MSNECNMDKMECSAMMSSCHGTGMSCEMDADGNCVVDSAMCAAWMAEGKCDSTACIKMEGGKCVIKHEAAMKMMGYEHCMKDSMKKEECCKK